MPLLSMLLFPPQEFNLICFLEERAVSRQNEEESSVDEGRESTLKRKRKEKKAKVPPSYGALYGPSAPKNVSQPAYNSLPLGNRGFILQFMIALGRGKGGRNRRSRQSVRKLKYAL